ncbi:MAG: ABC transporter permease [Candidatus Limnocylindria bacterium]
MSDLFPNALHVARREFLVRVRGRAFVITTVLLVVAIAAVTIVPTILAAVGAGDPPLIAVDVQADDLAVDPVTQLQLALAIASGRGGADGEPNDRARVTLAEDGTAAERAVRADGLDALLTITRADDGELEFEFLGPSSPTSQTRLLVTAFATEFAIADRLDRLGISQAEAASVREPPSFTAIPVDPDDARDAEDFGGAFILAYAVVILTFMAILTYGNWVAQSVAEEKSGRVMELLITAATPRQLMTGKVLGTGAAGLTQYAAIVAAAAIGFVANEPVAQALGVSGQAPISLPDLAPTMLAAFGAFFLLGFILYCTLYAAAGSMVSRIEDVQQAVGPLIFLAMAGYFAAFSGLNDPDAGWVGVLSLVPFFSPYLMPARLLLTSVDIGEVLLALALLAATLVAAIWLASRIYSAGVLMYGQRVGLRTIWRASRVSR